MIYVEMLGRMGNQMFSYAFARKLQIKNPKQEIALDFSNFEREDETWINYLDHYKCGGNYVEQTRRLSIIQKIILRIFFATQKNTETNRTWAGILQWFGIYLYKSGYFPFKLKDPFRNKLIIGFYESSKYFSDIKELLKEEFSVSDIEKGDSFQELVSTIDFDNAICIGIRKWPAYLDLSDYNVCTKKYYDAGIEQITKIAQKDKMSLYVFTEDEDWAKKKYPFGDDVHYICSSVTGQLKPWEAICLMTYFKYYVIANSSFFWWGQYLSKTRERITVAPAKWRSKNPELYHDIFENDWILIEEK